MDRALALPARQTRKRTHASKTRPCGRAMAPTNRLPQAQCALPCLCPCSAVSQTRASSGVSAVCRTRHPGARGAARACGKSASPVVSRCQTRGHSRAPGSRRVQACRPAGSDSHSSARAARLSSRHTSLVQLVSHVGFGLAHRGEGPVEGKNQDDEGRCVCPFASGGRTRAREGFAVELLLSLACAPFLLPHAVARRLCAACRLLLVASPA